VSEWRPSASLEALNARAELLQHLRVFFAARGVLEVETPQISSTTVTDPAIDALCVANASPQAPQRFLQTSPEYHMKRLIAAGVGDIFQVARAFRQGESGRRHNPEFSLLEWYRLGWDHAALMREVGELIGEVLGRTGWQIWPYAALFQRVLGMDPLRDQIDEARLEALAASRVGDVPGGLDGDGLLDLLMSHCVEPTLRDAGIVFVTDFPPSQSALSRLISVQGSTVAARFECYVDGIEVANGYWEQSDADALRTRFAADNAVRRQRGLVERMPDERLLAAQAPGLPDCAGVALGVDRLLALQLGVDTLSEVISFDWSRA
jgi:lysyl-tRNA synthetase class 2